MASSANGDAAADTSVGELGLPGWMENLLKPGVGPGVFTTLKASLAPLAPARARGGAAEMRKCTHVMFM